MSISAVIISHRNPDYLDLCLKSATENKVLPETEILVVLDGFAEESDHVIKKYPGINVLPFEENQGQTKAHNTGVALASNEAILILNDDNVVCREWDKRLLNKFQDNWVVTPNQIEPFPSIFNSFRENNFGTTPLDFEYNEYLEMADGLYDSAINGTVVLTQDDLSSDGGTWPVFMSKKWYQTLGGIDPYFPSPAVADHDFFMRCEMAGLRCARNNAINFYHFAGAATKKTAAQAQHHAQKEMQSHEYFNFKWGFYSRFDQNNSHLPHGQKIRGIQF